MGGQFSRFQQQQRLTSPLLQKGQSQQLRIVMFGLEGGGWEVLIPFLGLGEANTKFIAVSVMLQEIILKKEKITLHGWGIKDTAGVTPLMRITQEYFDEHDVAIYVVYAATRAWVFEAWDELRGYFRRRRKHHEKKRLLLILVIGLEDSDAIELSEVRDLFESELTDERTWKWRVQGCDAITGRGVFEGLEWVATQWGEM